MTPTQVSVKPVYKDHSYDEDHIGFIAKYNVVSIHMSNFADASHLGPKEIVLVKQVDVIQRWSLYRGGYLDRFYCKVHSHIYIQITNQLIH